MFHIFRDKTSKMYHNLIFNIITWIISNKLISYNE